ncbi:allatostatin-A receptor-like [Melanaphis sacchari]|uniref:Allatostatin-A receptor n=1 Tax=Melanaphis sacchari TaxID=742174 RepID=A0A2H8TL14_9HEMI|nr:allatostatin-A receptor-like [Melanaphis sacchari]XP_025193231.1 allatostatin-A receptor-like [Melanaphis sacchari]
MKPTVDVPTVLEDTAVYRYEMCRNISGANVPICADNSTEFIDFNNTDDDEILQVERIVSLAVPILFGIIVVVGLLGNLLVVIVVMANQQMRSTTNLLIINLALADLLFIVFCVPFTAVDYMLPYWPFGDVWCKMVQYLIVVTAYASVYTLVLMSLDRFLAVVHPIASIYVRTERNASSAILVTWVLIVLLALPVLARHGEVTYTFSSTEHTACIFLDRDQKTRPDGYNKPAYQIFFFLTSYAIPLAIICILYVLMLMRLWKGVNPGGQPPSAESRRGKKRVTRMVVVVVAIFAFCWFPIQVILVLKSINYYEITAISVIVQIVSHCLAYTNSCLNPILYAFLSENFRKAFRKVIIPWRPEVNVQGRFANGDARSMAVTRTTRTTNNDIL